MSLASGSAAKAWNSSLWDHAAAIWSSPPWENEPCEAAGQEFYYVIERKDRTRCGLVRLYDFDAESFTWGSWILDESKPRKAALESAVLIYQIGFLGHNFGSAIFEVLNKNSHTLAFHRRFGALETGHDELNTYFEYARARFEKDKMAHFSILESKNRDV